jgi:hypothetical protein
MQPGGGGTSLAIIAVTTVCSCSDVYGAVGYGPYYSHHSGSSAIGGTIDEITLQAMATVATAGSELETSHVLKCLRKCRGDSAPEHNDYSLNSHTGADGASSAPVPSTTKPPGVVPPRDGAVAAPRNDDCKTAHYGLGGGCVSGATTFWLVAVTALVSSSVSYWRVYKAVRRADVWVRDAVMRADDAHQRQSTSVHDDVPTQDRVKTE